ncbi:S8 family serine peptidase [Streptomyces goshikiensis]|uniref:S8 family serine peptidase n=1 Tax=Streptomyces goshikiensis TaxID=1942 RepID=UPI003694CDC2
MIIGLIDGPPDTSHPSLAGASLKVLTPWWLPPTPLDPEIHHAEAKHGTWTASVLVGQHGTNLPGLAPRCRVLVMHCPVARPDRYNVPDPLSQARAIEELTEAGAQIIQHTQPANLHYSASTEVDDTLKRVIDRAISRGVLVTVPAGNTHSRHYVVPATLPGVLVVGAQRADGTMFDFSNHNPSLQGHGIVARCEALLGATPGDGDIKVPKEIGTCFPTTLVTGSAALLLSLQKHLGQQPDPIAVRDALLNTAQSCTPHQTHGHPGHCLNGTLNLPAATRTIIEGVRRGRVQSTADLGC